MTIKSTENIQNFSEQKNVSTFDENYRKLRETAETELLKDSQFVTEDGEVENDAKYLIEVGQTKKRQVNDERHLLILAHSAEFMLESDSLDVTKWSDHVHEADQISSEGGGFGLAGRTPRLSKIRRQARLQCTQLGQEKIGESTDVHLQGRRIRLTQIRHQARSKDHSQLQQMAPKHSRKDLQGRIVRLSEFRRHARSKGSSLVQDVVEDNLPYHLVNQTSKVDQRERILADIFGEDDGSGAVANRQQPEADGILTNVNGGGDHSVPVSIEDQDKMKSVKGTMRLSQLRREARFGNGGTLHREADGNTTDEV